MHASILGRTLSRLLSLVALTLASTAVAVSPSTVGQGKQLFEKDWPIGNPMLGGDGLGPLFNGQSCVVCHHQGGVGGGGDSRFNANTIGIEELTISGRVDRHVIANMVRTFHPGFVGPRGTVINTLTLPHHGGSPAFRELNRAILDQVPAEFSESGGPVSGEEVRRSYATQILFSRKLGANEIVIRARLFQRNTTSLFGAGLIDQIPVKEIELQARAQKSHPEINGRPSTLKDGRIGRFGWRANVASLIEFVDQACANEVGLKTRRKPQGRDPMQPDYRNPTIDIADDQIEAMADFIAALPAPGRRLPESADDRQQVARGEQLFASVGCAVCHVPNLGQVQGLYSDLLLHEMGYESIDLNHAEPYVLRRTPVQRVSLFKVTTTAFSPGSMGEYYGATTTITSGQFGGVSRQVPASVDASGRVRSPFLGGRPAQTANRGSANFRFVAPEFPDRLINIVPLDSEVVSNSSSNVDASGRLSLEQVTRSRETYLRIHYEPTKFNEEWRTPPLWGLRDSAPYLHDGRAETVLEAIAMHDGESAGTRDRFLNLPLTDRHAILAFLDTLVAPLNAPRPMR